MAPEAMRSVQIGSYTYLFPFADRVPIAAADRARLRTAIQQAGAVLEPVVIWKDKRDNPFINWVIDGVNRCEIASELKLSHVPIRLLHAEDEDAAFELCLTLNVDRRQLSAAELQEKRWRRIARVTEARSAGKSTRAIAEAEGIRQTQVIRDLDTQVNTLCSPDEEPAAATPAATPAGQTQVNGHKATSGTAVSTTSVPEKVTGTDGKTYPAKTQRKPRSNQPPSKKESLQKFGEGFGIMIRAMSALGIYKQFEKSLQALKDTVEAL